MRFAWQEEQLLLQSMLDRYVAERHAFDAHEARQAAGTDLAAWKELAELGILGLPFAEEDGGSGGNALDVLLAMQSFGRGLVRLPYIASIVLGGGLLRLAGNAAQRARSIPPLIAGDLLLSFGFAEPQSRYNPADVATRARPEGDGYVLDGQKAVVLGAPGSHACFVTARTSGEQRDERGISLFLVPTDQLSIRPFATIDGAPAAEILLDDVHVPRDALFGEIDQALPLVEQVLDDAIVAISADAIGAMAALNEKCVEFAQTRKAFGQPIAGFQAIQHRLVDMRVAYEMAAAITLKAATQLAEDPAKARRTVAACKALVGDEAAFIGKTAVQLHGAIGITDELDIGHYFKRLTAMQLAFGGSDHHLRRCIDLDRRSNVAEMQHGH